MHSGPQTWRVMFLTSEHLFQSHENECVSSLSECTGSPFTKLANEKPASHANTNKNWNKINSAKKNSFRLADSHNKIAIYFVDKDQVCNANTLLFWQSKNCPGTLKRISFIECKHAETVVVPRITMESKWMASRPACASGAARTVSMLLGTQIENGRKFVSCDKSAQWHVLCQDSTKVDEQKVYWAAHAFGTMRAACYKSGQTCQRQVSAHFNHMKKDVSPLSMSAPAPSCQNWPMKSLCLMQTWTKNEQKPIPQERIFPRLADSQNKIAIFFADKDQVCKTLWLFLHLFMHHFFCSLICFLTCSLVHQWVDEWIHSFLFTNLIIHQPLLILQTNKQAKMNECANVCTKKEKAHKNMKHTHVYKI